MSDYAKSVAIIVVVLLSLGVLWMYGQARIQECESKGGVLIRGSSIGGECVRAERIR